MGPREEQKSSIQAVVTRNPYHPDGENRALAAHGHADALGIWLTIDGEPGFIDAGTYRYFSGGETRSALREGLAHYSLVIDGLTPSCAATPFSWTTCANARLIEV